MKTNIPLYLPTPRPAPDGYHWEYRGVAWKGKQVMYAFIGEYHNDWIYGHDVMTKCDTSGLTNAYYIELVKNAASIEEDIKAANLLVGKNVIGKSSPFIVEHITVFFKNTRREVMSDRVTEHLRTHDYCVAVCNGPKNVPYALCKEVPNTITIPNVGSYQAVVHRDFVEVGCQQIPYAKFEEISNAFQSLRK